MAAPPKTTEVTEASLSRWGRAVGGRGEDQREALKELAASYWYGVYAWWRRAGLDTEEAGTATLAAFTRWLGDAPPSASDTGAGRMREWLPARLAELAEAGVELTGEPAMAIDPAWAERRYADEPAGAPDAIFQRRWAVTVIEFTASTLQAEFAARGEEALFAELVPFAGFEMADEDRYSAAAARIGRTAGAMRKAVFDFRTRQREVLRAFVADTVLDPADAESEITALLCACDAPGPEAASAPLPTAIRALRPDEVLARAMQSVRMTGGGPGGWQPPTVEEATHLFPQYEVLSLLGRGGMGAVYKARQIELDRLVAIKLLPLEVSVDREFADRFRREARAMAKLHHPNIITVFDFGTTSEGHLFFAMEFVEGANLHQMIHGPGLSPAQSLKIIGGVCDALAYAHAKGVVHRDIKPANVMVSLEGEVKVADFGLARLTDPAAEQMGHTVTGTVMGTPDYMAPEQMHGMNVDHRADIYSLGVMLYEMLCQEVPRGIFDPPSERVAGVDARVDHVVIKAMAQQPDRRYQSTQEMNSDVSAAGVPLPKPPTAGQPASPRAPAPGPGKKNCKFVWAAVAGALVVLAGVAAFLSKHQPKGSGTGHAGAEATIASATKDAPFINTLGMKFVPAPIIGGPSAGQRVLFSVWDTRVQDYAAYASAKKVDDAWTKQARDGVPAGRELNHPVVGVSWEDAQGFCQWLTEKETAEGKLPKGLKYRLPTDEEWSWAVGLPPELGTIPAEKSGKNSVDFPWGKDWPPTKKVGNYADETFHGKFPKDANDKTKDQPWIEGYTDGYATISPVGSFPANAYGLYDMGGNVWQWCEDWFDASHKDRVLRGASWHYSDRGNLLSSYRNLNVPGHRYHGYGFRCVLAPTNPNSPVVAALLSPSSEPWQDVLNDPTKLVLTGAVGRTPEGLRFTGTGRAYVRSNLDPKRDGAVRMRATFGGLSPQLTARLTGNVGEYHLQCSRGGKSIGLSRWDDIERSVTNLRGFQLRETVQPGQDYELELRIVGQALTAKFNGEVLGTVTDTTIPECAFSVGVTELKTDGNGATATVKGFEVLDLDAPTEASSTAAAPSAATKDAPFVNTLRMKFVPVPIVSGPTAGERVLFSVWDTRVQDYTAYAGATKVDDSWTKQQRDGEPIGRELNHPVVAVAWDDAQGFCQWLTEKEIAEGKLPKGAKYRLPTDEEWSWAVGLPPESGGTPAEKGRQNSVEFPWGQDYPPTKKVGNYEDESFHAAFPLKRIENENRMENVWIAGYTDGYATTSPVGSFPANAYGLYDMGGNVWQWCEDWFDASHRDRVLRGASWSNLGRGLLRSSSRGHYAPGSRVDNLGFRCVLAVSAN